jgi:hypothetical protein
MNNPKKFGNLNKINLREAWEDEARDFTPWLAQEENIALLGDAIGIELEVEAREKNVGPFKADILCKDTSDDHYVLIENQLERTNHTHLGQLLTYASGLHAVTIIWIANRFTDEHRSALDWLNEITGEDYKFFGLEIELWRIGDSQMAPKFNIIAKPNDWSSTVARATVGLSSGELTDTKRLQLEYWSKVWELIRSRGLSIRGTKARPQHWNNFSIGRSFFRLAATVNTQKNFLRVELSVKGPCAREYFELLKLQRDNVENELECELEWQELSDRKVSRIAIRLLDADPANKDDWKRQHEWIISKLEGFQDTFRHRIKELNADDYDVDPEE